MLPILRLPCRDWDRAKAFIPTVLSFIMNLQSIFNTVWAHIHSPDGGYSEQYNHAYGLTCAYRGDGGKKCFVGACITDEEYDPNMEGKNFAILTECGKRFEKIEIVREAQLGNLSTACVTELQRIHDDSYHFTGRPNKGWLVAVESGLRLFAAKHHLKIPETV